MGVAPKVGKVGKSAPEGAARLPNQEGRNGFGLIPYFKVALQHAHDKVKVRRNLQTARRYGQIRGLSATLTRAMDGDRSCGQRGILAGGLTGVLQMGKRRGAGSAFPGANSPLFFWISLDRLRGKPIY
jgi:hypothetical protein